MKTMLPLLSVALIGSCAHASGPSVEAIWLKDWALSRCIAKATKGEAFSRDAELTAGALLERGSVEDFATYEKLEHLADEFLARRGGGSVPGDYNLLKCIELYHSHEAERLAREAN